MHILVFRDADGWYFGSVWNNGYKQYTFNSGEADQQVVKVYANGDKEVTQYENGKPYYIENIYTMENGVEVEDIVPQIIEIASKRTVPPIMEASKALFSNNLLKSISPSLLYYTHI